MATTRNPAVCAAAAAAIGPEVIPRAGGRNQGGRIFLAVRFESHRDVAQALPTWKGRTLIDVTNVYGVSPEALGGQPSSQVVAHAFSGA